MKGKIYNYFEAKEKVVTHSWVSCSRLGYVFVKKKRK